MVTEISVIKILKGEEVSPAEQALALEQPLLLPSSWLRRLRK